LSYTIVESIRLVASALTADMHLFFKFAISLIALVVSGLMSVLSALFSDPSSAGFPPLGEVEYDDTTE
jgi:hypothetical protein